MRRRVAVVLALLTVAGGVYLAVEGVSSSKSRTAAQQAARLPVVRRAQASGRGPLTLRLGDRAIVRPAFRRQPRAGLLFDLDTGRVLWQRNATAILPIASLAKMMTALLVAERTKPGDPVAITRDALAYQGSGVGVLPRNRRVRAETLLYGLLLPSGNDAALALAEHVAGSADRFVALMNATAQGLGLSCTHFASPDGFADANRSCAADLAVLARADLDEPRVARVVGSRSAVLPLPIKGGRVYLYNNNPLLRRRFPGITGLKTGETNAAGLCLVATARRGKIRLGSVLLHSPDLAGQSARLLHLGFLAERPGKSRT
jgi:D-alanyl-D-alanine carboxypeptidase (penicillin-binding protein 5/6)